MSDTLAIGSASQLLMTVALLTANKSPPVVESNSNVRSGNTHSAADYDRPRTTSHTEIDPATKSVVLRVVSEMVGTVVAQYPNEVQLRVREYVTASDAAKEKSQPAGTTA